MGQPFSPAIPTKYFKVHKEDSEVFAVLIYQCFDRDYYVEHPPRTKAKLYSQLNNGLCHRLVVLYK
jgi:hypothetical protein